MADNRIVIIKNPSDTDVLELKSFGISIAPLANRNLTATEHFVNIARSEDLKDKINNSSAVLFDSFNYLNKEDAIKYLSIESDYNSEEFSIAMAIALGGL